MEVSRGASAHQIAERILSEGDTTKIGLWTAPNGDFRKVSLISTKRWLSFGDFVMGIIHAVASLFSKARPTVSSLYEPRTAEKVGQLFSATLCAGRGVLLSGESPLWAETNRSTSLSKGVHREVESEGS